MSTFPFRFAVQAVPNDPAQWLSTARRAEQLGYSTLLMPDVTQLPSPLPALALAAGATTSLKVGTFVLASPLRPPRLAAWDAHTISALTGGRFEFGIGTGRPEAVREAARLSGQPPASGARRLALAEQSIDALRELDGDQHTPVLMAVSGPRARALAAAKADIVTPAVGPLASREEAAKLTAGIREAAGTRSVEFSMNIFAVGDEAPPWLERFLQVDMARLIAHDSLAILRGSPRQMADELQRRRDAIGVSYFAVNAAFADQLAPVVERLTGR